MVGVVRKGARNGGGGGARLVPGLAVRAGQTIAGKYRVEELLGSGPSGVVISARNIHLREQVTLKILASYTDGQEDLMARRLAKARLACGLASSHVARLVDIGMTEDGMPYVATEWLEGKTLEAELAERERFEVDEAVRWTLEACEGLAEAHAIGLIHGDLKPQNIFLANEGDARVLKLLDFGTTSPLDAIGDQSASAFFGSPAYLAPEQIQNPGSVDARADIWALGVLLYNLISGSPPFVADSLSGVIVSVVYDAPALLTDAPYELARLVSRCLQKDPANRPQNVHELAEALAPFAGAGATSGARLSERVGAMLAAPPAAHRSSIEPPVGDTIAASAMSLESDGRDSHGHEPLLLVTKRPDESASLPPPAEVAIADEPTRPSLYVLDRRRRRARGRLTAFGLVAAAAAVAFVSWDTIGPKLSALASEANEIIAQSAIELTVERALVDVPSEEQEAPQSAPPLVPAAIAAALVREPMDVPAAPPDVPGAARRAVELAETPG
jgi:serine/threonine protein kinase